MSILTALGGAIPLAFAAGLNVYATVAVLGLCAHFGVVALPEPLRAFDNPIVIGGALTMYAIEFVADKIPWFDSIWDGIHTFVRPLGGALIAVAALGHASPAVQVLGALLGGSVAMTTHLTKAGTRAAVNASPEPFSNWTLSFGEDALAVSLSYGAIRHPGLAIAFALALLLVIGACASLIVSALRRRFRPQVRLS